MSADDILRVLPSSGGGTEIRFNNARLGELSMSERTILARQLIEGNTGSQAAVALPPSPPPVVPHGTK